MGGPIWIGGLQRIIQFNARLSVQSGYRAQHRRLIDLSHLHGEPIRHPRRPIGGCDLHRCNTGALILRWRPGQNSGRQHRQAARPTHQTECKPRLRACSGPQVQPEQSSLIDGLIRNFGEQRRNHPNLQQCGIGRRPIGVIRPRDHADGSDLGHRHRESEWWLQWLRNLSQFLAPLPELHPIDPVLIHRRHRQRHRSPLRDG